MQEAVTAVQVEFQEIAVLIGSVGSANLAWVEITYRVEIQEMAVVVGSAGSASLA